MRREGEQFIIDITDTGVGLPADRERLTEPYMPTRVRGTGLGLAIVKKIVDDQGAADAYPLCSRGGPPVRTATDIAKLEHREAQVIN
jgi:two-component system nitrogen regulation sensor histidine kinase NtrY